MIRKRVFLLVVALSNLLIITGCAVSSVKPDEHTTDVISFSKVVVKEMSSKLDKLIVSSLRNKEKEHQHYKTFRSKFFPVAGGAWGVLTSYKNYCDSIAGSFKLNACIKPEEDNKETVLFFADIRSLGYQGNYERALIKVVSPVGSADNQQYLSHITSLGYRTQADIKLAAENKKKNELKEKQRLFEIEQNRLKNELPLLNTVGTKVCKKDNRLYYTGFVEKVVENKIQIRVNSALRGRSPARGFKAEIIWDAPANWHICKS